MQPGHTHVGDQLGAAAHGFGGDERLLCDGQVSGAGAQDQHAAAQARLAPAQHDAARTLVHPGCRELARERRSPGVVDARGQHHAIPRMQPTHDRHQLRGRLAEPEDDFREAGSQRTLMIERGIFQIGRASCRERVYSSV